MLSTSCEWTQTGSIGQTSQPSWKSRLSLMLLSYVVSRKILLSPVAFQDHININSCCELCKWLGLGWLNQTDHVNAKKKKVILSLCSVQMSRLFNICIV